VSFLQERTVDNTAKKEQGLLHGIGLLWGNNTQFPPPEIPVLAGCQRQTWVIFAAKRFMMSRLSIALNLVLLVAVSVLYYFHFSSTPQVDPAVAVSLPVEPGGIYFVNSDTLLDNYDFYKERKTELEARQERIRAELKSASQKLEADVQQYQQSAAGMTDEQRQKTEESLMMRQQQLVQKKEELLTRLDEEQAQYSDSLFKRLTSFLHDYNKGKGVRFILGYQRGGGILFANDSLDITRSVLEGLNAQWKEQKKAD
jgi:outer membrane protein